MRRYEFRNKCDSAVELRLYYTALVSEPCNNFDLRTLGPGDEIEWGQVILLPCSFWANHI